MTNFTVGIETDYDDNVKDVPQDDDLRAGLDKYNHPNNFTNEYSPIIDVKVAPLSSGKQGQKTCWLLAEIYSQHRGKGEPTSKKPALRDEIRSRGKPDDDCGHIIARSLGGKMVDFNLFPQNKDINRGWKDLKHHWRIGIERLIEMWLIDPSLINPRVEFEIRFYYNDQQYPNRPDHGKYLIKFKCDGSKESKQVNNGKKHISIELYRELKGDLMNTIDKQSDSASSPNYERVTPAQASKFHELSTEQFHNFVVSLLNDYKKPEQQQNSGSTTASSTYSVSPTSLKSK